MTAPVRIEAERRFPVGVDAGFAYITSLATWPEYWPRLVHIDPASRWQHPGDRARLALRMLGRDVELEMTLLRIEPDRLVEYRSEQRGLPTARHTRRFDASDDGFAFRILVEYDARPGWRAVLDRLILRRAVERATRETLDNLERRLVVEREAGGQAG